MTNTSVTNFRKNLFEYVQSVVEHNDVINVCTKNGNAVVLSEEDYSGLIETVYLLSHPQTAKEILDAKDLPYDEYVKAEDVEW